MLRRKAYRELLKWKNEPAHRCLMIKGARQVGKTYLVREFGQKEYASFIEINFIRQREMKSIFTGDLSAEEIYKRLTAQLRGVRLIPGETLIFLDEIQNCGTARTAIKFLTEDGRFDVISSGSLLGLTYGEDGDEDVEQPESVPTGYEEFLWAEGYGEEAISVLRSCYESREAVPAALNEKYENLFREYMVVGGMPEAVQEFALSHDFNAVARIQERILENYRFDISRHAKGSKKAKVRACYDAVPKQLAKELKKFQYSTVEKGKTAKKYGSSIQWLADSALVHVCYNIHEAYLPLNANAIDEQFKLYINDTGLLCAMYGFETKKALLMNTLQGSAKGGLYENVISESLIKNGYRLYYYKPDESHELEFLLEKNGEVVPVEVKAGNNATVSLNSFLKKYAPHTAYKFIHGNIGVSENKITLPHYMVMFV